MMREAIQERCRHAFTLEDLLPFTEGKIGRDQETGTFIPIGEDLKQQLGAGATE